MFTVPAGRLAMGGLRLSPDERSIAFTLRGKEDDILNLIPAEGGLPVELFRWKDMLQPAGWTQDGNTVLFTRSVPATDASKKGQMELWAISVKGGTHWSCGLAMDSLRGVRVHPDGRRIVFTSGFPNSELWVTHNLVTPR